VKEKILGTREIKYISLFEDLTGSTVIDCRIDDENNRVIYLVAEGQLGLAIGRRGVMINRLKKAIGKNVEVVEFSRHPETFIKKLFQPARVNYIKIMDQGGRKIAFVSVVAEDKGIAIGKGGKNINRARYLAKRWYNIDDIKLIDKPAE